MEVNGRKVKYKISSLMEGGNRQASSQIKRAKTQRNAAVLPVEQQNIQHAKQKKKIEKGKHWEKLFGFSFAILIV